MQQEFINHKLINMNNHKVKKIIIALDFDPTAQKVAEVGFSLAKAMCAEITLLHVITTPLYYSSTGNISIMGFTTNPELNMLQIDTTDSLKKSAQLFLDKSKQHLDDETIQTLVVEGDFAEAILAAAKSIRADIIVLGSHSQRWLESIIMGSVTEKVMRLSKLPIFIIPTRKN
jgi:nucleotide-binding universal stress UspA family protein